MMGHLVRTLRLDKAHAYDGALGTHCFYLLHRPKQKRRELMAQFEPLRVIAAAPPSTTRPSISKR